MEQRVQGVKGPGLWRPSRARGIGITGRQLWCLSELGRPPPGVRAAGFGEYSAPLHKETNCQDNDRGHHHDFNDTCQGHGLLPPSGRLVLTGVAVRVKCIIGRGSWARICGNDVPLGRRWGLRLGPQSDWHCDTAPLFRSGLKDHRVALVAGDDSVELF